MSGLFSHLRVSSEYSITQGLLTIDQIVASAKKNSVPSVALTDQSNMFGLVKFFKKCEESGIKPISGASIRCIFDDEQNAYELLCKMTIDERKILTDAFWTDRADLSNINTAIKNLPY